MLDTIGVKSLEELMD